MTRALPAVSRGVTVNSVAERHREKTKGLMPEPRAATTGELASLHRLDPEQARALARHRG